MSDLWQEEKPQRFRRIIASFEMLLAFFDWPMWSRVASRCYSMGTMQGERYPKKGAMLRMIAVYALAYKQAENIRGRES